MQFAKSFNGTGHQLGKETHKKHKPKQIALGFFLSSIHINHITDALKSIKRDACRYGVLAQFNNPGG